MSGQRDATICTCFETTPSSKASRPAASSEDEPPSSKEGRWRRPQLLVGKMPWPRGRCPRGAQPSKRHLIAPQADCGEASPKLSPKAIVGLVRRFLKRKGFSLRRRTMVCQRLPDNYTDKVLSFQKHVIGLCHEHNYELSHIANADQTPVWFDFPKTIQSKLKVKRPSPCRQLALSVNAAQ